MSGEVNFEGKVILGRKTAYSLIGAGFHSVNGLKNNKNFHGWSIFVVFRIVYGLEVLLLSNNELKFQGQSLRQIHGLFTRTEQLLCVYKPQQNIG